MRILVEYNYLLDNQSIIPEINAYYAEGNEVIIWNNNIWVMRGQQFTNKDIIEKIDVINDLGVDYTAFNINTRQDVMDTIPAYDADIYYPPVDWK